MVVRRAALIQYAERSGTKRSAGDSHGACSAQTASDGARSLAPGPGLSHGAVWARARGGTVREAGGEKQSEPGKVFRGPLQTASGGIGDPTVRLRLLGACVCVRLSA